MQKRKFKINILDIVIFIVILCSMALLIFHDIVDEAFKKPEIGSFDMYVSIDGSESVGKALKMNGKTVLFKSTLDEELQIEMTVADVEAKTNPVSIPNECTLIVSFTGYKRFGRYYTQNGERIYENVECSFIYENEQIQGMVVYIEETAK